MGRGIFAISDDEMALPGMADGTRLFARRFSPRGLSAERAKVIILGFDEFFIRKCFVDATYWNIKNCREIRAEWGLNFVKKCVWKLDRAAHMHNKRTDSEKRRTQTRK